MVKSKPGPCVRAATAGHCSCLVITLVILSSVGDEADQHQHQPPAHTLHLELGRKIKQWIRPVESHHWSTINMHGLGPQY